jgi:hypothetical protein
MTTSPTLSDFSQFNHSSDYTLSTLIIPEPVEETQSTLLMNPSNPPVVVYDNPNSPSNWSQAPSQKKDWYSLSDARKVHNLLGEWNPLVRRTAPDIFNQHCYGRVATKDLQLSGAEDLLLIQSLEPVTVGLFPISSTEASPEPDDQGYAQMRVLRIRGTVGPAVHTLQSAGMDTFVNGSRTYKLVSHRSITLYGFGNTWTVY